MNYKLSAFTLVETLITMVLIGIITAMTFSLINILGKQLQEYLNDKNILLEYYLLDNALLKDLDKTEYYTINENTLKLMTSGQEEITYTFSETISSREINGSTIIYNCSADNLRSQNSNIDSLQHYIFLRYRILNDTLSKTYTNFSDYAQFINKEEE